MRGQGSFSFEEGAWIDGTPYRVVRPLGLGGMGEVYEVDHTRTGTRRAIKVLRARADPRGALAGRLRVEGDALRAIDHPNVVRVYEVASLPDGRPYFGMQKLDGRNLRSLLRGRSLGVEQTVSLAVQALDGLAAAHARGIVHRDVKPSNLFLTDDGVLKVLDFGIARRLGRARGDMFTEPGMVVGTLRYMAPEQLRAGTADARTDVYALALVTWELIAGCHPFDVLDDASSSVMRRLSRPAPRLGPWSTVPVPGRLEEILARALAIDPSDRFSSATAFSEALRHDAGVLRHGPALASPAKRTSHASLTFATCETGADSRAPKEGRPPERRAAGRPRALGVAFAAHAVGVVFSACAVLLAMFAALAAARRAGHGSASSEAIAPRQTCLGAVSAGSRGAIGVNVQGR